MVSVCISCALSTPRWISIRSNARERNGGPRESISTIFCFLYLFQCYLIHSFDRLFFSRVCASAFVAVVVLLRASCILFWFSHSFVRFSLSLALSLCPVCSIVYSSQCEKDETKNVCILMAVLRFGKEEDFVLNRSAAVIWCWMLMMVLYALYCCCCYISAITICKCCLIIALNTHSHTFISCSSSFMGSRAGKKIP